VIVMSALANMENLIERLAGNIEAIINDRESTLAEIASLRKRLMERDEEAVKAAQDMRIELETIKTGMLFYEQERARTIARLQNLNDRLVALVGDEKHRGG